MKSSIAVLFIALAVGHSLPVEETTAEVKTTTLKLEEKPTTTMAPTKWTEATKWTTPKKSNSSESSESKEDDDKDLKGTTTMKPMAPADGKKPKKADMSMPNEQGGEMGMKMTTTTKLPSPSESTTTKLPSPSESTTTKLPSPSEPVPDAVHVVKKTTIIEEEVKAVVEGCKQPGTKKTVQLGKSTPLLEDVLAAETLGTSGTGPVISLQLDSSKTWLDEPLIVSTVTRMSDEMQRDAVAAAREGFRLYRENEYLVAKHIVTEFDAKYEPYWHCSAGESYEAYFTFEKDTFIRMSKGKVHLQLYKHFCTE